MLLIDNMREEETPETEERKPEQGSKVIEKDDVVKVGLG